MNKQKFISLIQHPNKLSSSDLKKLEELQKEYPYFSLSYALTARIKHQEKTPDAKNALGKAALYTADRHVLKILVTSPTGFEGNPSTPPPAPAPPPEEPKRTEPAADKPTQKETPTVQKTEIPPPPPEETPSVRRIIFEDQPQTSDNHLEDSFYEEVEANLKNLTAQKKALSMWIKLGEPTEDRSENDYTEDSDEEDGDLHPTEATTTPNTADAEEETPSHQAEATKAPSVEEDATPQELQKEPESEPQEEHKAEPENTATPPPLPPEATLPQEEPQQEKNPATPPPLPPQPTLSSERENEIISELNELKSAEPEQAWQREQTEMIDRFLEGKLANRRTAEQPDPNDQGNQEDLSLKSQEFGDNIISENLAQILTKQGKLTKAIEIYRKLIWKFPQKKAYFAALIEELKNKE